MKNKNSCDHELFQCVSCGEIGCQGYNCPNLLILDSNNPFSDNFEHGSGYMCNKCRVENQYFSFKKMKKKPRF